MIKIWYHLIYCSTHFFNMIPLEGTPSAIYYLNTTSYDKLQQSLFTTACLPSTWSTPWDTSNRKFSIQQHNTTIHKHIFLNHCIFLQNIQSYLSCFCDRRHMLTITNRWPMVRIWSIPPSHNKTEARREANSDTWKYIHQCPDTLHKKPDEIHILVANYINFWYSNNNCDRHYIHIQFFIHFKH